MNYKIVEVTNNRLLREFIDLPYKLYKDDPNFVPFIKLYTRQTVKGKNNMLFSNGIHVTYILKDNKKTIGRLIAGIDYKTNKETDSKRGYISLFECINDEQAAFMLFDYAKTWLKERGMDWIEGPISPSDGDDFRALLFKGFDSPPVLFDSYNPKFYLDLFETYGFKHHRDYHAFHFTADTFPSDRFVKVVEYSMKKYNFRIDTVNLKNIDHEIEDIRKILLKAVPESWGGHFVIPSVEDIKKEANMLMKFLDPELVCIARKNETNEPIGFVVGTPDYNQVFAKMNGTLFPFGIFKLLYYRKKITRVRIFMQFVIPEFQGRAVNAAIFYNYMLNAERKGLIDAEGSTVGEENAQALRVLEAAGGDRYKTYRMYSINI
ncbi:MAG: hypothetical protein J7L77_02345 [Clostridiales bacterium]|nr:hypothetical protein [Clostridiales bacterium]